MKRILMLVLPALLFIAAARTIPNQKVSGKITDASGMPIPGAIVAVKGTKIATTTAADGSFTIEVPGKRAVLIVTAVGFAARKVLWNGDTALSIAMTAISHPLEEVVVTGYSTRKMKLSADSYSQQAPISSSGFYDKMVGDELEPDFNTESYDGINENRFLKVTDNPLSTFSIDVDAASYSNVRRFLNQGQLPPAGAVRIEEMINYFHYEYPQPPGDEPFSINTEISDCPWNRDHKLALIGLQGKKIPVDNLPPSNIVFLIDVSGSMDSPMKLPLVKTSMKMLVDQLRDQDHIAMVVYAGSAGLVLPSTPGNEKTKIKTAIDRLEAGGSTAGGEGIRLAYSIAEKNMLKNGNNRVILCTDGDFNIGASSDDDMERLIEEKRKSGVFLTVLGYGMGNYKDSKMQKLADKGNGNHAYIDGISEAKKVLVSEFGGTLFTIAKDVKLQIEFNPAVVQGYRLIGYENRLLNKEDFNNDKKDAGELGSGHTVTALYEIIPIGVKSSFLEKVDGLKYQKNIEPLSISAHSNEIMTVKFRYKKPDEDISKLIEHPVIDKQISIFKASENLRFAAAVSEFGMLLRNSEFKSAASFSEVLRLARNAKGKDEEGYRSEFVRLVESAELFAFENNEEEDLTKSPR